MYVVLDSRRVSKELDIKEDVIDSVLVHLELSDQGWIQLLPRCALRAKVSFYGAKPEDVAAQHAVVRVRCCGVGGSDLHAEMRDDA